MKYIITLNLPFCVIEPKLHQNNANMSSDFKKVK